LTYAWTPTPEQLEQANVTRLARALGCDGDFHALHRLSVERPEVFWPAVIEDLGIEFSQPWESVLDESRGIEWATWFRGGRLNLAWNCLHKWARGDLADAEAAVFRAEDVARLADPAAVFLNVNTPEDLERARAIAAASAER